jgi:putative transposase
MAASLYPKKELHKIYKRRWDVALHLRSIKTDMKMEMLSSKTPGMVRKEIGIHLLGYNIIREIMVDGSIKENALPTKISFKGTLQLLNQFNPHYRSLLKDKKATLYSQMLILIAKNKVGKRAGRVEPRAIRRRSQSFPTLKTDRKIEQEKILAQRKEWMDKNEAA